MVAGGDGDGEHARRRRTSEMGNGSAPCARDLDLGLLSRGARLLTCGTGTQNSRGAGLLSCATGKLPVAQVSDHAPRLTHFFIFSFCISFNTSYNCISFIIFLFIAFHFLLHFNFH